MKWTKEEELDKLNDINSKMKQELIHFRDSVNVKRIIQITRQSCSPLIFVKELECILW